ncbi:MAG: alpha/beta hydrolase [Burkholderiaceae bacterium]|nr:alpha/beta hydrolase [Burkholderiaceae bacterium]
MDVIVNGQTGYYYTGGKRFDPKLPTIVFIHGAQNDHSVWALQTRYFAHHGFGVLAVDLPGHGRSKGALLNNIGDMADWLLALIDTLGVTQAMLVGHSMGSLIALEACAKAPERVNKLMLVGTAYPMKVADALLTSARDDEPSAIDMVNGWSHSSIAQKPAAPAPGFYVMGGSQRLMQRISQINPNKVFFTDFTACNNYSDGERSALKVTCPTLFLSAKNDQMTPPKASLHLSKQIPHSRTIIIENSGHQMMSEQPDAVLDALFSFAKKAAQG